MWGVCSGALDEAVAMRHSSTDSRRLQHRTSGLYLRQSEQLRARGGSQRRREFWAMHPQIPVS
jgi:hypothetical protein